MDIQSIILGAIGLALGVGVIWTRIEKISVALEEMTDAMLATSKAVEDKKITPEEMTTIIKELKEALIAIKAIFRK